MTMHLKPMPARSGKQTLRERLKRAKSAQDPRAVNGDLKKHHAPRPTTWPKLKFMEGPDPE